jgi:hypothetical protein
LNLEHRRRSNLIYIYRRAASEGADTLAEEILLQGVRAKRTKGKLLANVVAGDHVVCWGDSINPPDLKVGLNVVKILNNQAITSKFTEAQTLAAAGVKTVQVSRVKPAIRAGARVRYTPQQFALNAGGANLYNVADAQLLRDRVTLFLVEERQREEAHRNMPVPPAETWLGRRNNHIGGADLLAAPPVPDYYSKKEDIVEEYRIHMFLGKSIRAGVKQKQLTRPDGRTPAHDWIRSFDAGWKISYQGFKSTEAMRVPAAAALKALKLDFGAVDLGKLRDGSFIVLEVNRAPGVEGGTTETYAKKIIAWTKGELKAE